MDESIAFCFMRVRYAPTDRLPPARHGGQPRIVRYEEPPTIYPPRFLRGFFSAPVIIPLVFISAIVFGVLIYYWTVFSARIDTLLKGEVYTRSAGIYAAPKQLRTGESLSSADLVAYLKRAGYVEREQQADTARGRYSESTGVVEIEPSHDSSIDGQQQFQHLRVQFSRTGKSIASLTADHPEVRPSVHLLEPAHQRGNRARARQATGCGL